VRHRCRKDRLLDLWHAEMVVTFGREMHPSFPLYPEQNRLIYLSSLPMLKAQRGEIWSCESTIAMALYGHG
jgi:hypothetical protein